jgi:hypothetical protein
MCPAASLQHAVGVNEDEVEMNNMHTQLAALRRGPAVEGGGLR